MSSKKCNNIYCNEHDDKLKSGCHIWTNMEDCICPTLKLYREDFEEREIPRKIPREKKLKEGWWK